MKVVNIADYFEVSEHLIRPARNLKNEKGILAVPVLSLVQDFSQDDEFSRLMPGKKDCISIKGGLPQQKRLLLCNLNELYMEFKSRHQTVQIGFSKFCALRPKWCVSVGATHSVCVCTHHQNSILLVNAIQWKLLIRI